MNSDPESPESMLSRAQTIFKNSRFEYQELLKSILNEERGVMHLQKRKDIHNKLYEHIRRVIK